MTPAQLQADPDFLPYLTVRPVPIEEGGELRVGHFEFMPPSILD